VKPRRLITPPQTPRLRIVSAARTPKSAPNKFSHPGNHRSTAINPSRLRPNPSLSDPPNKERPYPAHITSSQNSSHHRNGPPHRPNQFRVQQTTGDYNSASSDRSQVNRSRGPTNRFGAKNRTATPPSAPTSRDQDRRRQPPCARPDTSRPGCCKAERKKRCYEPKEPGRLRTGNRISRGNLNSIPCPATPADSNEMQKLMTRFRHRNAACNSQATLKVNRVRERYFAHPVRPGSAPPEHSLAPRRHGPATL